MLKCTQFVYLIEYAECIGEYVCVDCLPLTDFVSFWRLNEKIKYKIIVKAIENCEAYLCNITCTRVVEQKTRGRSNKIEE